MTTRVQVICQDPDAIFDGPWKAQSIVNLIWNSRDKEYIISTVTITHNPEYPTPTINVVAPSPGIGFRVTDTNGNLLFTTKKEKSDEK